jgi:putative ABC transport system permease protein
MGQLLMIAVRSLLAHKRRTFLLGGAITLVTTALIGLAGISVGAQRTMLVSATTLMTGHVNVGGFYKVTAGQGAPVVTNYKKVLEIVHKEVPDLDYVTVRGRGWAKLVSDTGSQQAGIAGIDVANEPGFRKVIQVESGNIDDLGKPGGLMVFAEQAKRLDVKVGDKLTISAPTPRGVNNTLDVTVVAIAADVGMLSKFNVYLNGDSLRQLYQLNPDTTGALQIYLKDLKDVPTVQAHLQDVFTREAQGLGFTGVMDPDPRAFWMKFESVNREDWTGQKLDITNWEDEISFVKWVVTAISAFSVAFTSILLVLICFGMMNILWITIRERTREIGTLRAIGMQRRTVLAMFLTEGFVLGLSGTVLGVVIGVIASLIVTGLDLHVPVGFQLFLMTDHLVVTPTVGWVAFAIVFITGAITLISLIPSALAARLKPITAMHHIG